MEASKSAAAATSPSSTDPQLLLPPPELDSQLSSLIDGLSQQVQAAMENMLKMTNEVDQSSAEVTEEIEKCKDSALEKKKVLEEEKEHFEKAAYTVLDILNSRESRYAVRALLFSIDGPYWSKKLPDLEDYTLFLQT